MANIQQVQPAPEIQQTLGGPGRTHLLRASLLFVALALLASLIPQVDHFAIYAMAAAMFAGWGSTVWYQWNRKTLDYFEPIHVLGFVYLIYFGLGAIWTVTDPARVAYDTHIVPFIPEATLYCLLGYLALLAGYFVPWKERLRSRGVHEWPRGLLFVLLPGLLGFVGFMAQVFWYRASKLGLSLAGFVSSVGQLAPLFVFAWALAWLLFFSGKATRAQKLLLLLCYVPAAAVIILNFLNSKKMVIALVAVPLMALWYAKKRIPWMALIALILVMVFVIFPFNNTFRALDNRISVGERLSLTSGIMGKWSFDKYLDRSFGTFKERVSMVNSMAVVVRDVGRWVPFAHGKTIFMPTLVFFVPRVIWPEKPELRVGREFGETFRVVHVLDKDTNIGATVPGELYWNFGLPGVLLGMVIYGIAMRFYYRRYGETEDLDPVRRAIHLVVLIQFLSFEAAIAAPAVMIIRTLMVIEVYRILSLRLGLVQLRPSEIPQTS